MFFKTIEELVNAAQERNLTIGQVVLEKQAKQLDKSPKEIFQKMTNQYQVMQEAAWKGINHPAKSFSGLVGHDGAKVMHRVKNGKSILGSLLGKAVARSLAVGEVNAAMGKIVAAPTAGSCGVLPACLISVEEEYAIPKEKVVEGLLTAAGIGLIIAKNASISGAEGGCQAECGSASAMAAAAMVEILGGSPKQAAHATAISLKNILGLVCDPVAGLVEVPCVKRNAMAAVNAITAAEMALSGVESVIPVDEVVAAMLEVGEALPSSLKETAKGGLANTPTAKILEKRILK
ncbi:MAG: L-serine ammonia-lyase, iron-sulfur-dependent, subunit alpha [Bacillota bacterium]|nr:L-serine ammonia-lyase, iron-sulfur-dependent, subunit alpha [Bacillota bacterium]